MKSTITSISILVLLFLSACGTKETKVSPAEMSKFISAYTSGIISRTSPIRIILSDEFANDLSQDAKPEGVIRIEPEVAGEIYWFDSRTIEFKPNDVFQSGKEYTVDVNLDKLKDIDRKYRDFKFQFQTIKQQVEVKIEKIEAVDVNDLSNQKIEGVVQTADYEEAENISKMLHLTTDENKSIELEIVSNTNGRVHRFTASGIKRTDKASEVHLKWDAKPISLEQTGKLDIEIPALGQFKLLSSKVIHQPEQYVLLQFSDPLKQNQKLNGLVDLKQVSSESFIIENNSIKVFPSQRLKGIYKLLIYDGVKNIANNTLLKDIELDIQFEELKPAVRAVNKGVILPSSDNGLVYPFEAVNLKAVDVTIIRIYENNITQFLQVNELEGEYQLQRVGKPVLRKTVLLENTNVVDFGKWNKFYIALDELIKPDPGALYRITIDFRKQHSLYNCPGGDEEETEMTEEDWEPYDDSETSGWDGIESYYGGYYYGGDYWQNRDNPCHKAYYTQNRSIAQNILASDIGLIAKAGNDNSFKVIATDLLSTNPLPGAMVELLDYQQQVVASVQTNSDGIAEFQKVKDAYFVVASHNKQKAYIRLLDGNALSVSRFDVSGYNVQKGLKGFIFGERGVWRPGDSIYLSFILQEEAEPLPEQHPVILELYNPRSQLVKRIVKTKNNDGFYSFITKTESDAITGNYTATVKIGGVSFSKDIKIETVKPNRLKINIDFGAEELQKSQPVNATMDVKWLHGAIAKNLKAVVDVTLNQASTMFKKFTDYTFDDKTKQFYPEQNRIFEGETDENGKLNFSSNIEVYKKSPGKLKATFTTKVFEKSGNFSMDNFTLPFHQYNSYVGLKTPKGDKARGMLLTDTTHALEIVVVDKDGELLKGKQTLEVYFYKLSWKWWWDSSNDLVNFQSSRNQSLITSDVIHAQNGQAKWDFRIKYPQWGRYLLYVKNMESGHTSSKVVFIDWPGWAGRPQEQAGGAKMLQFTTDKSNYKVGENIRISIPQTPQGRALISLENGSGVVNAWWHETNKGKSEFEFEATADMTPNVYINITMLQPHAQTINDLPIRLYGIVPVLVENPETRLQPKIEMPDEIEPESEVELIVSEENNMDMTYVVAMVDEGLLDLTRFKTPDPWNHFYAREALGVKTWDIFDKVIGAYSAEIERLLAIGGGDEGEEEKSQKAKRFKPMVKFLGPFKLEGKKNKHKILIPQYIGSVRTMVIAANNKAYGKTEKTVPVLKPLMVLGTVPRVLGPGEELDIPITLFALKEGIDKVDVKLSSNEFIDIEDDKQTVSIQSIGEEMLAVKARVAEKTGVATLKIEAKSGKHKATYEIEVDVRNPNPPVTKVSSQVIEAGKDWEVTLPPVGMQGTNACALEVSTIPPINLEDRLKYLIQYPHGCIEQTTSGAFPQLFLSDILEIDAQKQMAIQSNIDAAINRIKTFQTLQGGFGFWPGATDVSDWGTNYAGHFLIEAEKKGYNISYGLLKKWKKYQRNAARNWIDKGTSSRFVQAYRLYTLALAGDAEKGAMNRLKQLKNLDKKSAWRLASAYHLAGKESVAKKMVEELPYQINETSDTYTSTYGSNTRDLAMILETLVLINEKEKAFDLIKQISQELSSSKWMSTQTTAYSLIAASKFIQNNKSDGNLKVEFVINKGKKNILESDKVIQVLDLDDADSELDCKIMNPGNGILYARLIQGGTPLAGQEEDIENNLGLSVTYKNDNGSVISPESIEQGTDFTVEVVVQNKTMSKELKDIALTQIFPSGWEIINERLGGSTSSSGKYTYQDIRDDRVYTYFDLNPNGSKRIKLKLNASYSGNYYLPAIKAEAMYDGTIYAVKKGMAVEVAK